jgi:Zn-dependent peptidase ImmA (M78 family)
VPVRAELLDWALKRSGMKTTTAKYEKFSRWASGEGLPITFKQLEDFAHSTHAPLGYLFLEEPPVENVPIPDFRTVGNRGVRAPSADLLDTIYEAQQRQDWFRAHAVDQDHDPLPFVGSIAVGDDVEQTADRIRSELDFTMDRRRRFANWEEALRQLIDLIEDTGVLVMVSGIVGANTHRVLDPDEFRGFALTDPLSSLIFINGADTKSAQIFTIVHELVHIWLGESALSDAEMAGTGTSDHELWVNRVAAEVLVPIATIRANYRGQPTTEELQRLARVYKVSTLVILKRIHDAGLLGWDAYRLRYDAELARIWQIIQAKKGGNGGDYYNTQPLRISQTFARAVIVDAFEGRTMYRDAFSLLGSAKRKTFNGMATKLGVA